MRAMTQSAVLRSYVTAVLVAAVAGLSLHALSPHAWAQGDTSSVDALSNPQVAAVREVYRRYKVAVSVRNGEAARRLVSARTLDHYESMRDLALHADEAEVRALSLFDKLIVLNFRLRLSAVDLQSISGQELFAYGVERGWIGESIAAASDIDSISVSGDAAGGKLVSNGRLTAVDLRFKREAGAWKFDLIAMAPLVELALEAAIRADGSSEDDYVMRALEASLGAPTDKDLWAPLTR